MNLCVSLINKWDQLEEIFKIPKKITVSIPYSVRVSFKDCIFRELVQWSVSRIIIFTNCNSIVLFLKYHSIASFSNLFAHVVSHAVVSHARIYFGNRGMQYSRIQSESANFAKYTDLERNTLYGININN